ncbi:hypothetical protein L1887_00239 [Cichorium endivia]|nr:hypothetical protein L1887_00239 [Cichorium endivia]
MASGSSSCSRVDQFFSVKKKNKFVSPLLKPGIVEEHAKLSTKGSPRANLSSSSYLVSSQNENCPHRTFPITFGLSERQDQVRRNLISEIESSSRNEYVETVPSTKVHTNKRQGSPSVIDLEDKSIKKRHLSSVRDQWHEDGETVCYNENQLDQMQSDHIFKYGEVSYNSKETNVGNNLVHELSLKKCNRTYMEAVDVTLCNTPRLLVVKVGHEKTSQSMRGSSIVSPGDAFWKEAIQVADDVSYHNKDLHEQILEESKEAKHYEMKHMDHMKNENDVLNKPKDNQTSSTLSSFLPPNDRLDIDNWLPSELCSMYKRKGISKLYPWQVDCLQVDGVLQKRNLVYCASTSAGKSFVAEILMLRRVLSTRKVAILVLPYVSICTEKTEHLEALLEPLGKRVCSYYGSQGGGTLPKDTSVAVCTIEKANSLLNRLLEEGRLSEVGIIVIDELHMVGDQHRGYLLELMLTKLRYGVGEGRVEFSSSGASSGNLNHDLQIVGMSATLPNVGAVADWLQAALYQTDFRPVPLEEYFKVGNTIYNKNMELVRTIPKRADLGGKDPDHIIELCNEVVQEGHSVLIFCSSRKGCESTARHVAKYLKHFSVNTLNPENEYPDIASAIDALEKSPAGLDPVLAETLPSGVAYHHAGLTVEEREIVENCYRKGLVRVLTATSTLAAGVNLPARRVIFRQPQIGRDFIDGTRYRQMSGRAGRTGIDTKGESVLICKPEEVKRIVALIGDSCPPLHSCLSEDKNGMTHAILEVVAGGIVQTANDIHRYVRCTLLNSTQPFEDVVKSAKDSLKWLCHRKFLEWSDKTKLYSTTPLGLASFGSSLCPEESLIVLDDLSRAREGFVLASDLHLVYLVTPTNVDVEPDWELYYERFLQLPSLDQSVGNRVGVQEAFLRRMAHGATIRTSERSRHDLKGLGVSTNRILTDDQMLRVCKRFYVALILSRLIQEAPVTEVCEAFKVARGMVQSLQENAGRFASMVSVFCERLGWHDLENLISKFQNRVSFGVKAEIAELTTIPFVKGCRARALYKAGLRTLQAIAEASIPEIAKAIFEPSNNLTQRCIQLGVAKKIINGARKIVLEKADEASAAAFSAYKALGVNVPHFSVKGSDHQNDINSRTEVMKEEKSCNDMELSKSCADNSVFCEDKSISDHINVASSFQTDKSGVKEKNFNQHLVVTPYRISLDIR